MRHAGTQTLETDRLFLRQLLPEDAEQMYTNWASDPEVTRFLRWELDSPIASNKSFSLCPSLRSSWTIAAFSP